MLTLFNLFDIKTVFYSSYDLRKIDETLHFILPKETWFNLCLFHNKYILLTTLSNQYLSKHLSLTPGILLIISCYRSH